MDERQTARLLFKLASAYRVELEPNHAEIWHEAVLADADPDEAEAAVMWLIRNDQRFPSVARFREVLAAHRRILEPDTRAIEHGPPVDLEQARRWVAACKRIVRPA
jgi:hypothetical protein